MVEERAKLVIDLGNSETRVGVIYGSSEDGSPRKRICTMSNRYSTMYEGVLNRYLESPEYDPETSRIFKYDGSIYCGGELCEAEFLASSNRPTANEKKYNSEITSITLNNVLMQGIMCIANIEECDISDVDVVWDVSILLPPGDIDANVEDPVQGKLTGAKVLANKVKEITSIDFLMPKYKKEVKIDNVTVLPEGHCAFIALMFKNKNVIREEYKFLKDAKVLIIDIGAGTTDESIVDKGRTVISSRHTIQIGGNNVHQKVRQLLSEREINLTDSAAREGTEKGYIYDAAKKEIILNEIHAAKIDVSKNLAQEIKNSFEGSTYPITDIGFMLVCGGGAETSKIGGIPPMSKYLVEVMKRLSKNIEALEYPKEMVDGEERVMSPRLMNIKGAMIISE